VRQREMLGFPRVVCLNDVREMLWPVGFSVVMSLFCVESFHWLCLSVFACHYVCFLYTPSLLCVFKVAKLRHTSI